MRCLHLPNHRRLARLLVEARKQADPHLAETPRLFVPAPLRRGIAPAMSASLKGYRERTAEQVERLEQLGLPAFWLSPREFEDIPRAIEQLGTLAGTLDVAQSEALSFRQGIRELEERYHSADPIRVFYQIWDQPLMTINRDELIGKAIELCGGINVFGHLPRLVPRISTEAVLEAAPEVIVTSGREGNDRAWLASWEAYPGLPAVAAGNLFLEPPDLLARPTVRMLEGVSHLCQTLETARGRL